MNKNTKKKELTVVDLKTVFAGDTQDSGKEPKTVILCGGFPVSTKVIVKQA